MVKVIFHKTSLNFLEEMENLIGCNRIDEKGNMRTSEGLRGKW